MIQEIEVNYSVENSILPSQITQFILDHSCLGRGFDIVDVNPMNIVELMHEVKGIVEQIVYVYPTPGHSLDLYKRTNYTHSSTGIDIDIAFQGIIHHTKEGVYSVIYLINTGTLKMKKAHSERKMIEKTGFHESLIPDIVNHYESISHTLKTVNNHRLPILSGVGVIPGRIIKSFQKGNPHNIPGYIYDMSVWKNKNSARFVVAATKKFLRQFAIPEGRLIILGSKGILGSTIEKSFPNALKIDQSNNEEFRTKERTLVLDCSGAGSTYLENIYPGSIILGEAYPPITDEEVVFANLRNISVYHIKGVTLEGKGDIQPPLSGNYGGTIACCMAVASDDSSNVSVMER